MRTGAHGRRPGLVNQKEVMIVSYNMQEPEWPAVCECNYDEVHDRMDQEDCLLHCDIEEEAPLLQAHQAPEPQTRLKKPPSAIAKRDEESAA